jgi:tetratricopeptide (TPR) repeat protein
MRGLAISIVCIAVLAGCQPGSTKGPPARPSDSPLPPPSGPAPEQPQAGPGEPKPPPPVTPQHPAAPHVPTIAEKRQAQDLALRAAILLDEGKEPEANAELAKARQLDPENALAKTLHDSTTVDPATAIGRKTFRYTVKSGERLSKIAEVYLKDQYKFYLLARYNNIPVPRNLRAGQVILVPGTGPIATPPPRPAPVEASVGRPLGPSQAGGLYEEGQTALKAGHKDKAYDLFNKAARSDPRAKEEADRLRPELVQIHDRRAREAYRRQDLDICIQEWDRVLELDSQNEIARLERQRAFELKTRLDKVG